MAPAPLELPQQLAAWARTLLPKGSRFTFNIRHAHHLALDVLFVPERARKGQATTLLAHVLAEADARGMTVTGWADPMDEPGNHPDTVDLIRWYRRFGLEPRQANDSGVFIERLPQPPRGVDGVLAAYEAAKQHDWSHDQTQAVIEAMRAPSSQALGRRRRP